MSHQTQPTLCRRQKRYWERKDIREKVAKNSARNAEIDNFRNIYLTDEAKIYLKERKRINPPNWPVLKISFNTAHFRLVKWPKFNPSWILLLHLYFHPVAIPKYYQDRNTWITLMKPLENMWNNRWAPSKKEPIIPRGSLSRLLRLGGAPVGVFANPPTHRGGSYYDLKVHILTDYYCFNVYCDK